MQQRWRQHECQKSNWIKQAKQHTSCFLYISLPSLHNYNMKMPNFTFYKGRNQAISTFSFSLWTWIIWFLGIQLQESSPTFDKSKRDGIITIKILKNENSLFRRRFCCPCLPLILIIIIIFISTLFTISWENVLTSARKHGTKQKRNLLSRTSAGWCIITNSFYLWAPV